METKLKELSESAWKDAVQVNTSIDSFSFIEGYYAGYEKCDQGLTSTVVRHLRDELAKKDESCQQRIDSMKAEVDRAGNNIMAMQVKLDIQKDKYRDLMQQVIEKESKDIDIAGRAYIVGMEAHKNRVKVTVEQYVNALGEYQKKCRESEHPPMEELRQIIFDFEKVLANLML